MMYGLRKPPRNLRSIHTHSGNAQLESGWMMLTLPSEHLVRVVLESHLMIRRPIHLLLPKLEVRSGQGNLPSMVSWNFSV